MLSSLLRVLMTAALVTATTNPKASHGQSSSDDVCSAPLDRSASLPRQPIQGCLAPPGQRRNQDRIVRCVYVQAESTADGSVVERTAYSREEVAARRAAAALEQEWQGWEPYAGETQGVRVDMGRYENLVMPPLVPLETTLGLTGPVTMPPSPPSSLDRLAPLSQGQTVPMLLAMAYILFRLVRSRNNDDTRRRRFDAAGGKAARDTIDRRIE